MASKKKGKALRSPRTDAGFRLEIEEARVDSPDQKWVCYFSGSEGFFYFSGVAFEWSKEVTEDKARELMALNEQCRAMTLLAVPHGRLQTLLDSERQVRSLHSWDAKCVVGHADRLNNGKIAVTWRD